MAANGADMTDVIAYEAYVQKYEDSLFSQIFLGAPSTRILMPHEGVKGKLTLTELIINQLARRYNNNFRGFANTKYVPVTLEVTTNTVEHYVFPKDFENSYLGRLRQTGQSSDDYPMQAYTLGKIIEKLVGEIEVAIWQAVKTDTPTDDDFMNVTFDGILKLIADKITATDITPVATGTLTQANILEKLREMWAEVAPQYQAQGTDIFVSYPVYNLYRMAYKNTYNSEAAYAKIANSDLTGTPYELGNMMTNLIPLPGLGDSQRVIITPRENLHYGYDGTEEWRNFDFEKNHRRLDFWTDFNIGVQISMTRDGIFVVNDQA